MGFGSAYVATAFALRSFDPVPAAAWRSAVATVAVVIVVAVRHVRAGRDADDSPHAAARWAAAGGPTSAAAGDTPDDRPSTGARMVRLLVLSALAGPVFLASMNMAVAGVGATIAAFVAGLYAVLAAVIAPFLLPERLTSRSLGGLVLALLGTALLAELDPAGADATGMAWGLLAAVSFAVYLVLARRWSARYRLEGLDVALGAVSLSTVVLGGYLLVVDPASLRPTSLDVAPLLAIGWMAAVAALGPVLMVASVRLIPAARSAAFLLLNPITATVLAVVLLGERPTEIQLLGGLLVLLGIAVATRPADMDLGRIVARVRA